LKYGEPVLRAPWSSLCETEKNGRPAFEAAHGKQLFGYLAAHPSDAAIFNAAMTSISNLDIPTILGAYDFSGFSKVVDVGGGHGMLLRAILERYPTSRGVLCDLPMVIEGAAPIRDSAVAVRCDFIATDFFESVPAGGDAYLMKRILHDWDDEQAVRILRNCRRAVAPGGKLLVMDSLVMPSNQPDPAKWIDLNMLVLLRGRERTEAEFEQLYRRAGLRVTRIVAATRISIVEGVPA
jgi:hypothetical protein